MSETFDVKLGDCIEVMSTLDADSMDAVVTDPPYGLDFMGKAWDHGVPGVPFWQAALRVAKPGAHLVAFGGTRTSHRLTSAIEDAGWEIRDCLMWLYGSGFPKSLDISKAIDKAAGAEREVIGKHPNPATPRKGTSNASFGEALLTASATDAARQWQGWGTALKPAWEPIILARKPFKGNVAANVQANGTGALNIDGCRIGFASDADREKAHDNALGPVERFKTSHKIYEGGKDSAGFADTHDARGRWPANVVLDEEAAALLDDQTGERSSTTYEGPRGRRPGSSNLGNVSGTNNGDPFPNGPTYGDTGGASRFFYTAKASRSEREEGLEQFLKKPGGSNAKGYTEDVARGLDRNRPVANNHPTVKPLDLMQWLCRLVTPPGGTVLDPFCGSGSTGCAALIEGFSTICIDNDPHHVELSRARMLHHGRQFTLGLL